MPYNILPNEADAIAKGLEEYYNDAWTSGIHSLMNTMAQSHMGIVTGYLDAGKDTYANFMKKSNDSFMTPFKAEVKLKAALYFANKYDVMTDVSRIAEIALKKAITHIPVPVLPAILNAITGFAFNKGREELHERSVNAADAQISAGAGAELQKFFTSDTQAIEFIKKSIEQYKLLGKFIDTLPKNVTSFDDVISFPKAAFRVQQITSSLNVSLLSIKQYLDSMTPRLTEVQKISKDYIDTVRTKMPGAVNTVLQTAYTEGLEKGQKDISSNKYAKPSSPLFKKADKTGAATQLAAYVAHAVAQGYYDVGNTGPRFGNPISTPNFGRR